MFKYLNLNPDKRTTTDCVIRAVSFVTDEDWETTFIGIAVECLIYHDMPEYNYIWAEYLRKKGFRKHILPDTCPVCYTVKDFCMDHPLGTYLLVIVNYESGGHVVAVRDGDYYDIWDSGNEVASYYWRKEID